MELEKPTTLRKAWIFIMLVLICAGSSTAAWKNWPFAAGFIPGLLFLLGIAHSQGMTWTDLKESAFRGIRQIEDVIWLLPLIGLLIPSWTASGVIPFLMDFGIAAIYPQLFLASAFVITLITSMLLGTTLGTLSVIGIPVMGMAQALNIPVPMVAGALVSGAVVGDRSSPLSGTFNMLAAAVGITPREHFRALLPTGIIGLLAALFFFLAIDWTLKGANLQVKNILSLAEYFTLSPVLLMAPLALIAGIGLRMRIRNTFLWGIAVSILLAVFLQGVNPELLLSYMLKGYSGPGPTFLHSTGFIAMLPMTLFVIEIGAFNGVLMDSGLVDPYIKNLLGSKPALPSFTWRAMGFGILLDVLTCNQSLPVVLSGSSLRPIWSRQFKASHLSRVVADSVQLSAALVPWNLMAVLISTI
ncbi:MAG: hypothetical protein ABRQ26_10695, partial [Syntrophomonadaceae bacterium]